MNRCRAARVTVQQFFVFQSIIPVGRIIRQPDGLVSRLFTIGVEQVQARWFSVEDVGSLVERVQGRVRSPRARPLVNTGRFSVADEVDGHLDERILGWLVVMTVLVGPRRPLSVSAAPGSL